jgi:predicted amidophosphoribosyltransferase
MNTTSLPVMNTARANSSPRQASKRLAREWRTIETMVRLYCRDHHHGESCAECQGLLDYASLRLDRCRFGTEKPTCAKCPVHCYQKNRREQVRVVMRYAGPRMLWEHPLLSLRRWLDGLMFAK